MQKLKNYIVWTVGKIITLHMILNYIVWIEISWNWVKICEKYKILPDGYIQVLLNVIKISWNCWKIILKFCEEYCIKKNVMKLCEKF